MIRENAKEKIRYRVHVDEGPKQKNDIFSNKLKGSI